MGDSFIYMMVIFIVVADVMVAQYMNTKRKALDPTAADYAQRDKVYRLIIKTLLGYSLIVAVLLIVVVKPMLAE